MANLTPIRDVARRLRLTTTIDELLDMNVISVRTRNGCMSNGVTNIASMINLTQEEMMNWKSCGKKVASEVSSIIEAVGRNMFTSAEDATLDGDNADDNALSQLQQIRKDLYCFSIIANAQSALHDTTGNIRISLSDLHQLSRCTSDIDSSTGSDSMSQISSGLQELCDSTNRDIISIYEPELREIAEEIRAVTDKISELFDGTNVNDNLQQLFRRINSTIALKEQFPFLSAGEIAHCEAYMAVAGELPKLYIVHKCLTRSATRQAKLLCMRYGLYSDGKIYSAEELAELYNITNSRVRQLTDADGIAVRTVLPENLVDEADFDYIVTISEDDDALGELIERQGLELSPKQVITLMDILSKRLGSKPFVKGGRKILFPWNAYNKIDFQCIDELVKSNTRYKLTANVRHNLDRIVAESAKEADETDIDAIRHIVDHYISEVYKREIDSDGNYTWEQTHVSFEDVLDAIADCEGVMSTDEIMSACEARFPGLKCSITEVSQNPYLAAVGLKGYVPVAQRAQYFTSVGDCAEAILVEVGRPMSSAELLDEVIERGCATNLNSLKSLLGRKEEEERFVRFESDQWGLKSVDYDDVTPREVRIIRKRPFVERMADLKAFVRDNGRMPASNRDEEEASMVRWIRNVKKGVIDATPDELATLDSFLSATGHLPQNLFEYKFLQNCESYRNVVASLGHRPSPESRPQLCLWFYSSLRKRDSLSPNNSRHLDELLSWLESQGVSVD